MNHRNTRNSHIPASPFWFLLLPSPFFGSLPHLPFGVLLPSPLFSFSSYLPFLGFSSRPPLLGLLLSPTPFGGSSPPLHPVLGAPPAPFFWVLLSHLFFFFSSLSFGSFPPLPFFLVLLTLFGFFSPLSPSPFWRSPSLLLFGGSSSPPPSTFLWSPLLSPPLLFCCLSPSTFFGFLPSPLLFGGSLALLSVL